MNGDAKWIEVKQSSLRFLFSSHSFRFFFMYLFLSLNVCHMTNWRILGGSAKQARQYIKNKQNGKEHRNSRLQTKPATRTILQTFLSIIVFFSLFRTVFVFYCRLRCVQSSLLPFALGSRPHLLIPNRFCYNFYDGFLSLSHFALHYFTFLLGIE